MQSGRYDPWTPNDGSAWWQFSRLHRVLISPCIRNKGSWKLKYDILPPNLNNTINENDWVIVSCDRPSQRHVTGRITDRGWNTIHGANISESKLI